MALVMTAGAFRIEREHAKVFSDWCYLMLAVSV